MNLRLACAWVREQMLERAAHRLTVGPDRAAREDAIWEAAVAEVDGFLDPQPEEPVDVLDAWVLAGGEIAGVG